MKNFRKACRGQRGFTLIELLVVIMILGVLAAVVTLAVTRFIGKGTTESANAEVVTVQAAIESCLADANSGSFTAGTNGAFVGTQATSPSVNGKYVSDYLRQHKLKASYSIAADGSINSADASITGGWGSSHTFDNTTQKWS